MCTTRHFAIALALVMIPEEMQGQVAVVNYINGKNAAIKYLSLQSVCEKEIETIIWDLINYIKEHKLISQIDINSGNNESFLDFFINIFTYPSYWYPSETGIFLCLSLPAGAHAESRKVFFI